VLRSGVGRRVGRAHVNEGLDRTDVDDPAPGRAELFQKGMCHVEHAMKVDRHDILLVLDHGLGIRGEGLAPVDAGIVDQDRDLAHLRADARSNLAAPVVLGHIDYEAPALPPASVMALAVSVAASPLTSRTATCAPSFA
jgi:hypothetical protein